MIICRHSCFQSILKLVLYSLFSFHPSHLCQFVRLQSTYPVILRHIFCLAVSRMTTLIIRNSNQKRRCDIPINTVSTEATRTSAGIPFNPSSFPLTSKPVGYFIGYTVKFNVQKFYVLPTECIMGFLCKSEQTAVTSLCRLTDCLS